MSDVDRALPAPDHVSHELRRTSVLALVGTFVAVVVIFVVASEGAGEIREQCLWCGRNGFDEGVRSLLRWEDSRRPAMISHVVSAVVAPLLAIGLVTVPAIRARRGWHGLGSFFVILNVFLLTTGITDGVKKYFSRERPGFAHGRAELIEAAKAPFERNLSFFSGDTAWAFTFAAAGMAIALLRGYRVPRWMFVLTFSLGGLEAYLRIAADMHWATDVLAGAAAGTLMGSLPFLIHRRHQPRPAERDEPAA